MIRILTSILSVLLLSAPAVADLSSTVKLTSDYTVNGISQTDNSPALQANLNYSDKSGVYAMTALSNVDFGNDTNLEWDFFLGISKQLNQKLSANFGIGHYVYHGAAQSYKNTFSEVYSKFGYDSNLGKSEFNLWYTWDFFGSKAAHYVYQLAHNYEIQKGHTLRASFAMPTSLDKDKFSRKDKDGKAQASYTHLRLAYQTSISGFNLEAAVEGTSLDAKTSDTRVVVSASRTFGF